MPRARLEKRSAQWPGFSCSRRFAPLFRQARLAALGKLRRAQTMVCLDAYGFMQDLAVDFFDGFAIERPGIQLLHARENLLFARGDAQGDAAGALQPAYFESETRAHVQQVQQSGVNRVNFRAPIANFDFTHPASPFASSADNEPKNKKGRVPLEGRGRLRRLGAVLSC